MRSIPIMSASLSWVRPKGKATPNWAPTPSTARARSWVAADAPLKILAICYDWSWSIAFRHCYMELAGFRDADLYRWLRLGCRWLPLRAHPAYRPPPYCPGYQVSVGVHCHLDGAVAHLLFYVGQRFPVLDQERRESVPEIMDMDLPKARLLQQGRPDIAIHGDSIRESSHSVREEQAGRNRGKRTPRHVVRRTHGSTTQTHAVENCPGHLS